MQLFKKCSSCQTDYKIKSTASSRSELSKSKGDEFVETCGNCLTKEKIHCNEVRAKEGVLFPAIAVVASIAMTYALWSFLGGIAVASFAFPVYAWQSERRDSGLFNRYKID